MTENQELIVKNYIKIGVWRVDSLVRIPNVVALVNSQNGMYIGVHENGNITTVAGGPSAKDALIALFPRK